uniref:Sel1 repeat family protein n=1 Tax=Plectus sambesii TaxID=2011161 RepID=A0A914WL02_9BILA
MPESLVIATIIAIPILLGTGIIWPRIFHSLSDEGAVTWYTRVAEQGDARAQFILGLLYLNGQGVPQSDEEAVTWFTKSAEQEYADAQFLMGIMYMMGQGMGEECLNQMRKLSNGTQNQQNKDVQTHNVIWDVWFKRGEVFLNQIKKL